MNKKTNKLAFLLALPLALVAAFAPVAKAQDWSLSYSDAFKRIRHTTIKDGAEQIVYSGKGLLLALIRSTGEETAHVFVRDTSVANGATGNNRNMLPRVHWFVGTEVYKNPIPYPMPFQNGLSIDIDLLSNGEELTVVYLPFY